jgi:deazaflavin-dependent oxidoreductase (nitroreductase family)
MTATDPRADHANFTQNLIEHFRANDGTIVNFPPFTGKPLLLLHTVGAKSGASRIAPLMFSRDGDRYVIMASKGGAAENPSWFANVVANPEVTVEADGETFKAHAHVYTEGAERDRLWNAHAAAHPQFNGYVAKTSRVIPAIALERIR